MFATRERPKRHILLRNTIMASAATAAALALSFGGLAAASAEELVPTTETTTEVAPDATSTEQPDTTTTDETVVEEIAEVVESDVVTETPPADSTEVIPDVVADPAPDTTTDSAPAPNTEVAPIDEVDEPSEQTADPTPDKAEIAVSPFMAQSTLEATAEVTEVEPIPGDCVEGREAGGFDIRYTVSVAGTYELVKSYTTGTVESETFVVTDAMLPYTIVSYIPEDSQLDAEVYRDGVLVAQSTGIFANCLLIQTAYLQTQCVPTEGLQAQLITTTDEFVPAGTFTVSINGSLAETIEHTGAEQKTTPLALVPGDDVLVTATNSGTGAVKTLVNITDVAADCDLLDYVAPNPIGTITVNDGATLITVDASNPVGDGEYTDSVTPEIVVSNGDIDVIAGSFVLASDASVVGEDFVFNPCGTFDNGDVLTVTLKWTGGAIDSTQVTLAGCPDEEVFGPPWPEGSVSIDEETGELTLIGSNPVPDGATYTDKVILLVVIDDVYTPYEVPSGGSIEEIVGTDLCDGEEHTAAVLYGERALSDPITFTCGVPPLNEVDPNPWADLNVNEFEGNTVITLDASNIVGVENTSDPSVFDVYAGPVGEAVLVNTVTVPANQFLVDYVIDNYDVCALEGEQEVIVRVGDTTLDTVTFTATCEDDGSGGGNGPGKGNGSGNEGNGLGNGGSDRNKPDKGFSPTFRGAHYMAPVNVTKLPDTGFNPALLYVAVMAIAAGIVAAVPYTRNGLVNAGTAGINWIRRQR